MASFERELLALVPRLRRLAYALARNADHAEDLVQTALERSLARRHQFRLERRLDVWLFAILRNAWVDDLRAERRRVDAWTAAAPPTPTPEPVQALALRTAIAALPPDQRLAVALVLVEGYSYREAARLAGVAEGTLASRVARGRAALLEALDGKGAVDDPGR